LIVRALRECSAPRPQDATKATYAAKISKADAVIEWSREASLICRQVRAFDPSPGATTTLNGATIKVWRATPEPPAAAPPGTVVRAANSGIVVAAGDGAVRIGELQRAGGKRLCAAAFVAGARLTPGVRLGA
jgi:methionyl-tRNA formyltransferase